MSNMKNNKSKDQAKGPNKVVIAAIIVAIFVLVAAIVYIALPSTKNTSGDTTSGSNPIKTQEGEMMTGKVTAVIDIADYGQITLELDADMAPITVTNFVNLANAGFYDELTFHRIMSGFMMQGGDPAGNGTGGSDTNIKGEFSANGVNNTISHTRGTISMARSQDMDSASSQFFICHDDATFLDGQYAAFGHVTEGIEVVDAVCEKAEPVDDNGTILRDQQPVINSITIQ